MKFLLAVSLLFAAACTGGDGPGLDASTDASTDGPDADGNGQDAAECYSACPDTPPDSRDDTVCCRALDCSFGEETCCGLTFGELVCSCAEGGTFGCGYTDACLADCCLDVPCGDGECGPAPGAPSVMCEDGSMGGPVCRRNVYDGCIWSFRTCPEELCAQIECPPDSHCELEPVYGCSPTPRDPKPVCVSDVGARRNAREAF